MGPRYLQFQHTWRTRYFLVALVAVIGFGSAEARSQIIPSKSDPRLGALRATEDDGVWSMLKSQDGTTWKATATLTVVDSFDLPAVHPIFDAPLEKYEEFSQSLIVGRVVASDAAKPTYVVGILMNFGGAAVDQDGTPILPLGVLAEESNQEDARVRAELLAKWLRRVSRQHPLPGAGAQPLS